MPKIVFTEQELEDYLCSDDNLQRHLGLRFVGRQVRTQAGIIDILAYTKTQERFVIIELKTGLLDSKAFFQLERYVHCFEFTKGREPFRLLVGSELSEDLHYSVHLYRKRFCDRFTSYALYGFDFDTPISFCYYNINQQKIERGTCYD
jgi:hypothetical protein